MLTLDEGEKNFFLDVLMAFGLHCVGCFANAFDTIGQGARIHGMHEEEIKELISEIKKVIKSSKIKG
jgi:hybrid cluster-associated redox disulfide protein